MSALERATRLASLDLDDLLRRADDPGAIMEGVRGDLETSIIHLRQEIVGAVIRRGHLAAQLRDAEQRAAEIEQQARAELERGEERAARRILSWEIPTLASRDVLRDEVHRAGRSLRELLSCLVRVENRAHRMGWGSRRCSRGEREGH
jgi:phage shock protein A